MLRPLHIHVEEPSMEAFLGALLPRIFDPDISFKIISHQSKNQLLTDVPTRLRGYANYRNAAAKPKVLILVDRDRDNCIVLKQKLEVACQESGLTSKTSPAADGSFEVVNRIVVEELEAWYFGDVPALTQTFPGIPATLGNKQGFRDPDAIGGGTHEQLLKVAQRAGHFKGCSALPKIETARRMGALINPGANKSASFNHFLAGLRALLEL